MIERKTSGVVWGLAGDKVAGSGRRAASTFDQLSLKLLSEVKRSTDEKSRWIQLPQRTLIY